jgi:hypothetical protein
MDLIAAFFLFVSAWPTDFSLLGGIVNRLKIEDHSKIKKEKKPRSPRSGTHYEHLPSSAFLLSHYRWIRSSLVVRVSDCQCTSCNGPGFDSSIRRHSGIWGAAYETVLNTVQKNKKYIYKIKKGTPRYRGLAGNAAYRWPAVKQSPRRWREGGDSRYPSASGCRRWKSVAGAGYAKPFRPGYAESRPQYATRLKIISLKAFSAFISICCLYLTRALVHELDNQLASKFLAKYKVV